MNIGVELITETMLTVVPEHNFTLELYAGNVLIPQSAGRDSYAAPCNILPRRTVAATGRASRYHPEDHVDFPQGRPAQTVPVSEEDLKNLQLRIINNKILDQAELKQYFSLRVILPHREIDVLLARPDVQVFWESRGEFLIPLGKHVA